MTQPPKDPANAGESDELDAIAQTLGARKVPRPAPLHNRYVMDMKDPISGNEFGVDVTAKVEAIQAQVDAAYQRGCIDERKRVDYEIESFTKEVKKGRISNIMLWFEETFLDAHNRRKEELNAKEKTQENN